MIFKNRIFWLGVIFCCQWCLVSAQIADTTQAAQFLSSAQAYIDSLQYKEGINEVDKAIHIYEAIDPQYYRLGYAYNVKGDGFYEQGVYEDAMAYFMNARDILWQHFQEPHVEIAQSINFLGLCAWQAANLDQAIEYFQTALDMRLQLLGEMHPKVADSYNNLGNVALQQQALNEALNYYQRALSIRVQSLGKENLDVASSLNNIGTCYTAAGQYGEAFKFFQESLKIRTSKLGIDHPKIAQSYLNMGDCFYHTEQLDSALTYYEKALVLFQKHLLPNHLEIAKTYENLGNYYSRLGNQSTALPYFEKSLAIRLTHDPTDSPNLIPVYNSLANAFEQQGDYQKALVYYQKNLHTLSTNLSYGPEHSYTAITHNNIGQTHANFTNFNLALQSYSQALGIYTRRNDRQQIAQTLLLIGNVFLTMENYTRAIDNFSASLDLLSELGLEEERSNALIFQNLGIGYYNQQKYDLALANYQKAYDLITAHHGDSHPIIAPYLTGIGRTLHQKGDYEAAINIFEQTLLLLDIDLTTGVLPDFVEAPLEVLQLLNAKGNTHLSLFQKSKKTADLQFALTHFDYAIRLTQQIRQQYQEAKSKIALGEISYENFAGGIQTCYLLYQNTEEAQYLEKAFTYSELSRSNLVLEALNTSTAKSFSGIPDSLLKQENDLKIAITYYEKEKRVEAQKGTTTNTQLINQLNDKIFTQKQLYEKLMSRLESDFPQYFQLKYATNLPTIEMIQKDLLTADRTLIEYFVADSTLYVFVLDQEALTLQTIPISKDTLFKQIRDLRKHIHDYYLDVNQQSEAIYLQALTNYTSTAQNLYQKVFQPVENQLTKELVIINGGILNYLPFDALIASPIRNIHKPKSYDYLLKKYEISYGYSATLLHHVFKNSTPQYQKKLLAFAPEFSLKDRRNLAPLNHNIPEAEGIQSLIAGDIFTAENATKSKFEELVHLYQIIHLSTHGQSDTKQGDFSYLAFAEEADTTQNGLLYTKDIYNLSLTADLVVLSACETGKGEALNSEGAVSLGRAFFYSGAKSILNTLWSVDDASTGALMKHFYKDLSEGVPKSTALRQAKLRFIEEGKYAHPYYWSAFMLVGDRTSVKLGSGLGYLGLSGLGLLFLAGLTIFLYRSRRS